MAFASLSTRAGFFGFLNSISFSLLAVGGGGGTSTFTEVLLFAVRPGWWPAVAAAALLRAGAGWATAGHVLRDRLTLRLWWLVPLQDVLSFLVWIAGFFGNTILWRGRKYYLLPDGGFKLLG